MIERSEYKGNQILVLKRNETDKFAFSFGLTKAKLILENLEAIKKFVAELSPEDAIGNIPENTAKENEQ
jgi:hypothetical protein